MNSQTVHLLNQLNQEFYQTVASSFDETRAAPWEGWLELHPYIKKLPPRPVWRVLDLGCGNGRFGVFWQAHLQLPFTYIGLDSSWYLLKRAQLALENHQIQHLLIQGDLVAGSPLTQTYDVVVVFGVLHHIPSFALRQAFLAQCANLLSPQGLLVVTRWQFYHQPRLRQRIVPWGAAGVPPAYQNLDLEPHDYLLDWRRDTTTPVLRYCHHVDEAEMQALCTGLTQVAQFKADQSNEYHILCYPPPDNPLLQ